MDFVNKGKKYICRRHVNYEGFHCSLDVPKEVVKTWTFVLSGRLPINRLPSAPVACLTSPFVL